MYRETLDRLQPGMVIATDVQDEHGRVLLRAGTTLTTSYIDGLRRRGQASVQVRDGLADDVEPRDIVSGPLRASAASHLSTVFQAVAATAGADGDDRPADVDEAVRRLGGQPLLLDDAARRAVEQLFHDVEQLLSEVLDSHAEAGLESLKTHSDYTYQHSVDVAAVAALMGHRGGLQRPELRDLALGCLLHDLGKIYIDVTILDKPGKLTAAEFDEVKRHPYLGFELVRRMPLASILPAHVAYQHHERQDGRGYPRQLRGSNRMIRTSAERFDPKRMLLIAEIAAVADVYSALTSDRPYRAALRHDESADVVSDMAGKHLNSEVVDLFQRIFPRYPVGHWVTVTGGRRAGCRGVVVAVPPTRPDRPTIRLLVDGTGVPIASPEEVDLRLDEGWTVELGGAPAPERVPTPAG